MAQDSTSKDYANKLSALTGINIAVVDEGSFAARRVSQEPPYYNARTARFKGKEMLAIPIGDYHEASETIMDLRRSLDKAGILSTSLLERPWVSSEKSGEGKGVQLLVSPDKGGQILIPVDQIMEYDRVNGKGSFFQKLAPYSKEMTERVKQATNENAPPSLVSAGLQDQTFDLNPPAMAKNSNYHSIPDFVWNAALQTAKNMRKFAQEHGIDIADSREMRAAKTIDGPGGDGKYTDEKGAALIVAKISRGGLLIDKITMDDLTASGKARELEAQQITLAQKIWREQVETEKSAPARITPPRERTESPSAPAAAPASQTARRNQLKPPEATAEQKVRVQAIMENQCGEIQTALAAIIKQRDLPDHSGLRFELGEEAALRQFSVLRNLADQCNNTIIDGKPMDAAHFNLAPPPQFALPPGQAAKPEIKK